MLNRNLILPYGLHGNPKISGRYLIHLNSEYYCLATCLSQWLGRQLPVKLSVC
ncbi:unnamed protein product, partial [Schistosoma mattheei]|uniref:Uncharacterized protein n=1 Tax=Schistosoma mattheei TaxID=31246 RepID=A0AA85B1C4_9TREM